MKIGCHRPALRVPALLSLFLLLALGAGRAHATTVTSVGSGMWTNPTAWSPAQVPTSTDDVVIATGTTKIIATNSVTSIASLTVQTGGMLTHSSNTTTAVGEKFKVILSIANDLTIEAGAQINVDGRGYLNQNGPGFAGGNSGSGHGGVGGIRSGGLGTTYGSITAPTNLGSGGGTYASMKGGGAVILTVGGSSTINGLISASATNSNPGADLYDAPSGGSVFLITGSLTGSGTMRANGGAANNLSSGGGGRIAVILTNSMDFSTVKLETFAGTKMNGSFGGGGAGGTIYLQHTNHLPDQGQLVVNYNNNVPGTDPRTTTLQNGMAASSNMFSEIILTNGGVYALDTNDTLTLPSITTIQGDPTNKTDGIYLQGGTLNVPSPFSMSSNYFIGVSAPNATFTPVPSLTVRTNELLVINAPFTLNCPLTIASGGIVTHVTNATTEAYKVDLTVNGNLDIQAGGQVNVDGNGYVNAYGPGKFVSGSAGGGHGGLGGKRNSTDMGGTTYGSIVAPTNLGSGGGYGGANGGGAVRLNVTGTTTVNGVISANSKNVLYSGSGGSVFLTTGTLEGNGIIRASSPSGAWAMGGAGRVAVILTNGTDFGSVSIQACSGLGSAGTFMYGGAGTVYLRTMTQDANGGTLWINATNMVNAHATVITSNVTGTVVGTLVITNGAVLHIESNQTLTVNGSWLNRSRPINVSITNWTVSFTSAPNSTVVFAGVDTTTIAGTNLFFNFTCTNAVKTVEFAAGSSNIVNGLLALGGGATFKSTIDGSPWHLKLAPEGTQLIGIVRVRDSHAGSGQPLIPARKSTDLGNNINWLFFKSSGALILVR